MQLARSPLSGWFATGNAGEIETPALILYPERIETNIKEMIAVAGGPERLRPHVKTHKIPEIIHLQIRHGIRKVKCSTIAEAEMAAEAGADDILLAYQPVGPNISRFFLLIKKFPSVKFSCISDCESILKELSHHAADTGIGVPIWLDINAGMNRTGIEPGETARELFRMISLMPGLVPAGLHVYDGHINEKNFENRVKICDEAFAPVRPLIEDLTMMTGAPVKVVAGGSPTFPVHARRKNVELSPGTTLLWDYGYGSSFTDLKFLHAAVLLTRVVSKPSGSRICIDLGHKAVASEMPQPRIHIEGMDDYRITGHSEEHMVIETKEADKLKVGDHLYAIPWHVCPTVDRFDTVYVSEAGMITGQWRVEARKRKINI